MDAETMDLVVATQVNDRLKHCAVSFAKSATECSNTEIRQTFVDLCQDAIRRQAALAKLMEERGWYVPPAADREALQTLMPQLTPLAQGIAAGARA